MKQRHNKVGNYLSVGFMGLFLLTTGWSQTVDTTAPIISSDSSLSTISPDTSKVLSLDECIRMALKDNLGIQIARENVKISESSYRISRGLTAPGMTFSGSNSRSTDDDETDSMSLSLSKYFLTGATLSADAGSSRSDGSGSAESYTSGASLSLTQPLLKGLWGSSVNNTPKGQKIQAEEIEITRSMQNTRRSMINSVTAAYYRLIGSQRNIITAYQAVDEAERLLKVAQVKKEEGMVAKIDVTRSEVQLANRKSSLVSAQRSYQSSMESFADLLGLPLGSIFSIDTDIKFTERDFKLDECIETALKNRLDYRAEQLQSERTDISLWLAKRNRLPQLDAKLSYGAENTDDDFNDSWNLKDAELRATLVWSVPLLQNHTDLRENYLQAVSAKKIADISLEESRRSIVLEVRQAVISVEEAKQNLEILKESVKQAEESLRLAKRSYEEGFQTYLDVLDSQNSYTNTQNSYTSAIINYLLAVSNLERVLATHPLVPRMGEE